MPKICSFYFFVLKILQKHYIFNTMQCKVLKAYLICVFCKVEVAK